MKHFNVNEKVFDKGLEIINNEIKILTNKECNGPVSIINNIVDIDIHSLIKQMLTLGKTISKYEDISNLSKEEIALIKYEILDYKAKEISFLENLEKRQETVKAYLNND